MNFGCVQIEGFVAERSEGFVAELSDELDRTGSTIVAVVCTGTCRYGLLT